MSDPIDDTPVIGTDTSVLPTTATDTLEQMSDPIGFHNYKVSIKGHEYLIIRASEHSSPPGNWHGKANLWTGTYDEVLIGAPKLNSDEWAFISSDDYRTLRIVRDSNCFGYFSGRFINQPPYREVSSYISDYLDILDKSSSETTPETRYKELIESGEIEIYGVLDYYMALEHNASAVNDETKADIAFYGDDWTIRQPNISHVTHKPEGPLNFWLTKPSGGAAPYFHKTLAQLNGNEDLMGKVLRMYKSLDERKKHIFTKST